MRKYEFLGFKITAPWGNPVKKTRAKKLPAGVITPPAGRVSQPDYGTENDIANITHQLSFVTPSFVRDAIPTLRKLYKVNEDVGSIVFDLISLTNTGHIIEFDQTVPPAQVDKMRKHLENKSRNWGSGVSGINGLVNKMIAQVWISGALSNEWIPQKDLKGIQNNSLVNPENIYYKYNKRTNTYEAYQKLKSAINVKDSYIKLNPFTYKYFGLINDTDEPYGIPPFLTVLESIGTQKDMKTNINHILKQLGLLGYLEVKVAKPDQKSDESSGNYVSRLKSLLKETKQNVQNGFMDGVVTGFEEDHEFQFHSTTKNMAGVSEIFNQNERQIANGLKTSPNFLGLPGGGTETNMGIVFTKMLSQLQIVQSLISKNLEAGYALELSMAGYNFKSVKVKWKPSTVTDDLKIQQGLEIKQRVAKALRVDGIIGQDKYAEIMGYERPYADEPVVPYEDQLGKGNKDAAKQKETDSEVKKKSEKKTREKDKNQPRRKEQKN